MTEYIGTFEHIDFETTGSTNDEARAALQRGVLKRALYTAAVQTAGRGRRGRSWVSERGNLFASLTFQIPLHTLGQAVILSGLAVARTVEAFAPQALVEVKWPNDVLVAGAKISGILFENGQDNWWIMGVGINIVSAPEKNMMYPTENLHRYNPKPDRHDVLVRLIGEFEALERQWLEQGFEPVGKSWLDKAYKRGKKITIKQENKVKEGVFDGIDRNGGLLLRTAQGLETILVGDVFEVKEKND